MKQHKREEGALRNGSQVEVGDGALQLSQQKISSFKDERTCAAVLRESGKHTTRTHYELSPNLPGRLSA